MVSDVQGLRDDTSATILDAIKKGCGEDNVEIQDERSRWQGGRAQWNVDGPLKREKKIVAVMTLDEFTLSMVHEQRDEQLLDNGTYHHRYIYGLGANGSI